MEETDWQKFKTLTEYAFENLEIHSQIWGYQIQKHTKWNTGLTPEAISDLEKDFNLKFPIAYSNMLQHINGFDKLQISVDPEGKKAPRYARHCYKYPEDINKVQWLIEEGNKHIEYAKEALEESGFNTKNIEGFIPLYSHRALAVFKDKTLSPVLSMVGSDIIVYGNSLEEYWCNEFNIEPIKIRKLKWFEAIRLRPAMYIGKVSSNGFSELLKEIIHSSLILLQTNNVAIDITHKHSGKITIKNIGVNSINNNWSRLNWKPSYPFHLEFQVLNALSSEFNIVIKDEKDAILLNQSYNKGQLINSKPIDIIDNGKSLEATFTLDEEIWGEHYTINTNFVRNEINEYAYLLPKTTLKVNYAIASEMCNNVYYYKNGLKDRLQLEILKGLGDSYFNTYINTKTDDIELEVAFAFREYSVDESFVRSYVNYDYTSQGGTHVSALIKGIKNALIAYLQKVEPDQNYKIPKNIKKQLLAVLHVQFKNPNYRGSVKNKLDNPEIAETITKIVSKEFLKTLKTKKYDIKIIKHSFNLYLKS